MWFLYLKHYGYAFSDEPSTTTTTTASLDSPCTSMCRRRKRTRVQCDDDPLPKSKKRKVTSKTKSECLDESGGEGKGGGAPSKKRKVTSKAGKTKSECLDKSGGEGRGGAPSTFDEFPGDSILFQSSQESVEEPGGKEAKRDGNDLFLLKRKEQRNTRFLSYFPISLTISMMYLGLLFTDQKILLSDLARYTLQCLLDHLGTNIFVGCWL